MDALAELKTWSRASSPARGRHRLLLLALSAACASLVVRRSRCPSPPRPHPSKVPTTLPIISPFGSVRSYLYVVIYTVRPAGCDDGSTRYKKRFKRVPSSSPLRLCAPASLRVVVHTACTLCGLEAGVARRWGAWSSPDDYSTCLQRPPPERTPCDSFLSFPCTV